LSAMLDEIDDSAVADVAVPAVETVQPDPEPCGPPVRQRRFSVSLAVGALDAAGRSPVLQEIVEEAAATDTEDSDTILVTCPDGVTAGEVLVITCPDGREVDIDVPEGVSAGQEFEVFVGELSSSSDNEEEDEEEQHVMVVLCPAGKQAGDVVVIETVDGLEVEVEIPPGVNAGDEFEIVI
jgi:hypothetical protein